MRLMTSDEHSAYPEAIRAAYGRRVEPPRTGRPERLRAARVELPPELTSATVHKERESNRVVGIRTHLVFGTALALVLALIVSKVSRSVNTCFVERHNGTDRNRGRRNLIDSLKKTVRFRRDFGPDHVRFSALLVLGRDG